MHYADLINIFRQSRGGTDFVGVTALTNVKLEGGKKNPMQGRVTKCSVVACFAYGNKRSNGYENAVNRAREERGLEPDFEVGPLPYGDRIPNTPIIVHKGKFYLQIRVNPAIPPQVTYYLDGIEIAKDKIEGLPPRKDEGVKQGLGDDAVITRTFKDESIVEIRAFGDVYR